MSADIEKYKTLYEYQKDQFDKAKQSFHRLEDKAIKYLSSLTFAFSAYIILIRSIYDKFLVNPDALTYAVYFSIALTFYAMCSSWSFVFRAIQLQKLVKMSSDIEIIDFFKKNTKASIFLALSKKYSEAIILLNEEYDKKLNFVQKAYTEIVFASWSFLVSVTLIFIHLWR